MRRPLFIIALSLLLLCSCGQSPLHRSLLHAESIMEEHPDSAFTLLYSLSVDSCSPEEDRALYGLLMTQAMYKTNRLGAVPEEEVDSYGRMMDHAIGYFGREDDRKRLMESYYYRGVVLLAKPDSLPYALHPFSLSLDLAIEQKDTFCIAKNYDMMAEIFVQGKAYRDQAEALKIALDYFKTTGRKKFIDYTRYSLANAEFSYGDHEKALLRIDTLLSDLPESELTSLKVKTLNLKARAFFFCARYSDCISQIEYLDSIDRHQPELTLFRAASFIQMDSLYRANEIIKYQAEDLDTTDNNMLVTAIAPHDKNMATQTGAVYSLYDVLARDYKEITQGNFNTIQTLVNRNVSDRYRIERKYIRLKYTIYIAVLILTICALVYLLIIFIKKRKAANIEIKNLKSKSEMLISELKQKKDELDDISVENGKLEEELERYISTITSLQTKYQELSSILYDADNRHSDKLGNMVKEVRNTTLTYLRSVNRVICEVAYKSRNTKGKISKTDMPKLAAYISSFDAGNERVKEWEDILDVFTDGAMSALRVDSDMPKEYADLALYLFYGFDTDTISELIHKDKKTVYNIKGRLIQKIQQFSPELREKYEGIMTRTNVKQNHI